MMRNDKIKLAERFSDVELARMFNVERAPNVPHSEGDRRPAIDEIYCFNDIKVQWWSIRKRKLSRGERKALQGDDTIREGITTNKPGKSRVADLAKYYQNVDNDGISPFTC